VDALHRSYGAAGLLTTAATVAVAISGPWRCRLLDQRGLRKVVLPSVVVQALCWSTAPWVDYWWLLGLAALAGLFVVQTFSVVRQIILNAVPPDRIVPERARGVAMGWHGASMTARCTHVQVTCMPTRS